MAKSKPKRVVFLVKANDALISHCTCTKPLIGAPSQMDCPWCGCGWLFLCPKCRKAFSFARAEVVELDWQQLAHNDLEGKWGRQPTTEEVQEWISFMKILLKDVEVGKEYVYIDGWVFSTDSRNVRFDGWYARHQLDRVPQTRALNDRAILENTLGNKQYWLERKLQN